MDYCLLGQLQNWENNKRILKEEDFERLVRQLIKLSVYKELVVYKEDDRYIVLGGNMRLRGITEALRRIKNKTYPDEKITQFHIDRFLKSIDSGNKIKISVVEPVSEAEKLEYNLSDNDRVASYEEDGLNELVFKYKDEINLDDYAVDMGEFTKLSELDIFKDEKINEKEIDESLETNNKCPKCGYEW